MARLNPEESFENLKTNVVDAIGSHFPHDSGKRVIELKDITVDDNKDPQDIRSQKKAKLNNRTWGVPVKGTFVLKDKQSGKVISEDTVKIATIPKITERYSYLVEGTEYQVENLWRLKPGVYTRTKANGQLESHFNVKGRGFHVNFDPASRAFKVRHGGAQPPLYPIMKAMGVSDERLEKTWGKAIFDANKVKRADVEKKAIAFAKRLDKWGEINDYADATAVIKDKFGSMEMDPEATKRTLGKPFKKITADSVVSTSQKLLGVARGEDKPDDRDSLMFKELLSIEDLMGERVRDQADTVRRRIDNNINRKRSVKSIISPDLFGRPVTSFFAKTSLANPADQINPLEMVIAQQKTTILGEEGGIKSAHRITDEAKLVNASHMGVLDPLHTPENDKTGVSLHLSLGAKKVGRGIKIPLFDVKKGKMVQVSPEEAFESVVALPDEVKWKDDKPIIPKTGKLTASLQGNEIGATPVGGVRYVMKNPAQLFTLGSNLVPFLQNNSANRATMAGRQMEQAISLKHREQPLVQSVIKGTRTFDDVMGTMAAHKSSLDGKVVKVAKDFIRIKGTDGKTTEIDIYDDYPLNDKKSFLSSTPLVQVGDVVKKGQPVADTNFSKGGQYAPGVNLNTAYVPYKGLNFEDGIVISETAAKKLTSEHMYKKGLSLRDGSDATKKKYRAYFPDRINQEQAEKLDDEGVVKPGTLIMPGDTLITGLVEQKLTTEQQKLRMMHKSLVKPYKDKAITWEEDRPGRVVEVHKRRNGVAVHVKTEEPAEIGDKIVARHANKGIITAIVPDKEMPHTPDGVAVDTLMNPLGVPGRINLGQVLETAAGKIAKKRGKIYKVKNFDGQDHLTKLQKEMKEEGLTDTETLIDPMSGRKIEDVFIGQQYTLKLQHQVGKKMSARSRDAYDRNLIPRGGGAHGAQSLGALGTYAMLAHGATENLREFQTIKCFTWSTPVITDDGVVPIGKIVNQELPVRILSYNHSTQSLEYQPVLNFWKRPMDDTPLVEMTVHSPAPSGVFKRRRIRCTHEHEIYNESGEKVFSRDMEGRRALAPAPEMSNAQRDLMVGSLLGDGCLQIHNGPFPVFQERHCVDQKHYLQFKADLLATFSRREVRTYNAGEEGFNCGQDMCEWATLAQPAFSYLHDLFYTDGSKCVPYEVFELLTPLAVAVWYQDDGSLVQGDGQRILRLHTGLFDDEDRELLINALRDKIGVVFTSAKQEVQYEGRPSIQWSLRLGKREEIDRFLDYVRPFVHSSMAYKVGGGECGQALTDLRPSPNNELYAVEVESVRPFTPNLWEGGFLYNLEVDVNHNYFAGGILVGNSDKAQGGDSDELWAAIQAGEKLPPPKTTFAYKKFIGYMNAMGVNVEKDGNSLNLLPLTDKQVLDMSHGEIKDGGRMIKMKTLEPEKGGLFDQQATGGMGGTKWSHIKLKEPMPNPLFEKAIRSVTGIRGPEFNSLMSGERGVTKDGSIVGADHPQATYGPSSFGRLLAGVDVKKQLSEEEKRIGGLTGQNLNEANRRIKYLRALNKTGMNPTEAYMMKNVPVLPPAMRPLSIMDDGSLNFDDVNQIYKHVSLTNQKLHQMHRLAPDEEKSPLRTELYDNLKALTGIGGTLNRQYPGILDTIAGTSPKLGYAQDKLVKRKQDMSMRSTIIPEPSLGLDEVGLPRKAAMEMFKPFVVRELRRSSGLTPLAAQQTIKDDRDIAHKALDRVVKDRPVLLKRDPVLHKYGIQAFRPKLTSGRAIQIHPLVTGGYNADFDGDAMAAFVPVSDEAVREANKMKPSNLLFSPSSFNVMYTPAKEMQVGLYLMAETGEKTAKKFKDRAEMEKAYDKGEIKMTDVVKMGSVSTTLGRARIDSKLPENLRGGPILTNLKLELDKGEQKNLFSAMAKSAPKDYPRAVDDMKNLGNEASYECGFSFGLKDFEVHRDIRDAVLGEADRKTKGLDLSKPADADKYVDTYFGAMGKMKKELKRRRDVPKYKTRLTRLDKASGVKGDGLLQITGAPVLFEDSKGDVVLSPVRRSYSEGLKVADYWANMAGGRKGIVQKVQSVRDPGYLSKLMINSTMNQVVDTEDCGTDRGVNLSVLEPDVIGRFTATEMRAGKTKIPIGTVIDTDILDKLKNSKVSKVVVRSPMRCNHHNGICSKCYGLNEDGVLHDRGTNIGILAAQALGEPGTQMAMKAFHSGGVYEGKSETSIAGAGLDRAKTMLNMPKIVKGSAVLSTSNGRVSSIRKDPAGGYNVSVGSTSHYVPHDRALAPKLRAGSQVRKGDPITLGPVNPHDMLPLTGINRVQGQLASELHGIYGTQGIRRRNSEVVVRAMSNITRVEDPGDNPDLVRGDYAPTTTVQHWNKKSGKKGRPVMHTPVMRGVKQVPLDMQEDWLARLNHEKLKETIIEGAQRGWSSDLHGVHPIPPLIYSAEFGKKKPY